MRIDYSREDTQCCPCDAVCLGHDTSNDYDHSISI